MILNKDIDVVLLFYYIAYSFNKYNINKGVIMRKLLLILIVLIPFISCSKKQEPGTIKIALLPVLDSLPVYIAADRGYFKEENLNVEIIPVNSPVERDQLMQAGEIDAMLNELTSVALFNREEPAIKAVITARAAVENGPVFSILAAPESGIKTPVETAGIPIAVSPNTIIEYLTYRLLEEEGVDDIEIISVPVIPERFQLLINNKILLATLPDPLASAAIIAGAKLVIDDAAHPFYSQSVISFSVKTIENNKTAVHAFLKAWIRAVNELNADTAAFKTLFIENMNVPESVRDSYVIPRFPDKELPSEAQWEDVISWLKTKNLLEEDLSFEDSVADFLGEL